MRPHQSDAAANRTDAKALEITYRIYNHLLFVAMQLFLTISNQSMELDNQYKQVLLPF
jgi:hypothetical protein